MSRQRMFHFSKMNAGKPRLRGGLLLQKIPLLVLMFLLGGCEGFFSKKEKIPLEGKRETVLFEGLVLKPDPMKTATSIVLPKAMINTSWPMASGNARHAMDPVALNPHLTLAWYSNIGRGSSSTSRLLNGPVIGEEKVFAVDANGVVSALDLQTGSLLWTQETIPPEISRQSFSGGVAYDEGMLYIATSGAEVLALKAKTGEILWRTTITAPVRSAPTVAEGRVFVLTINNRIEALEAKSGQVLWNHSGMIETAGLLGGSSPAVYGGVVIVPYSSGEIFALHTENGFPLWSESLSAFHRLDSISSLAHIKARPVIDRGQVFLTSHSGRTNALDLKSGRPLWSRNFGGIRSPAVVGDFLFMLTNENNLVCLIKKEGHILWSTLLPTFQDTEKREGKILWAGPIVAENQLILAGSNGQVIFVSAEDGKVTKTIQVGGPLTLSPVVANKSLVLLTENADLYVYR